MLPESTIEFTTRTPLWTGNAEKKSEEALETAILGSLRWWAETYLRGHGYAVPDIGVKSGDNVVAKWLGCTEQRRQFRFLLTQRSADPNQLLLDRAPGSKVFCIPSTAPRRRERNEQACWYFPGQPLAGDFRICMPGATPKDVKRVEAVLTLAAQFGAVGARAQSGCGVICTRISIEDALAVLDEWRGNVLPDDYAGELDPNLPSLRNLFFAEYVLSEPQDTATNQHLTFRLRQRIRDSFRVSGGRYDPLTGLRHQVCGTVSGAKIGSKVFVSFPYYDDARGPHGIIRIWGWLPAVLESGWSRQAVLGHIARAIADGFGLMPIMPVWSHLTDEKPEILPQG